MLQPPRRQDRQGSSRQRRVAKSRKRRKRQEAQRINKQTLISLPATLATSSYFLGELGVLAVQFPGFFLQDRLASWRFNSPDFSTGSLGVLAVQFLAIFRQDRCEQRSMVDPGVISPGRGKGIRRYEMRSSLGRVKDERPASRSPSPSWPGRDSDPSGGLGGLQGWRSDIRMAAGRDIEPSGRRWTVRLRRGSCSRP